MTPDCWNVYQKDNRTNYDIEGWHNKLNKIIGENVSIWKFIKGIKRMHALAEEDIAHIRRGEAITRQKRKYKNMNQRLNDLGILYEDGNTVPIDYFIAVSNELGFGQ